MESVLGLVRHSGNDALFRSIEMSLLAAAAARPLHLHAEGLRGTGKTTIMRAVRRVLPRIRRIRHCLYNCDPERPHCPHHRGLSAEEIAQLGDEWVSMPFLEISHSAKVGTVVGSIDLSRLVNPTNPEAALLPGTIPQAHRGIIFVDEINRLAETAPELADILLDVMGTKPGRVQIEETGLPSVEVPVQVTVWAASNPDEDPGPLEDIRRQLSDRFDFAVYTDRPSDPAAVEEILASGTWDGQGLAPAADEEAVRRFHSRLTECGGALSQVQVPRKVGQHIADLYSRFSVESLRAVQAVHLGARLSACLEQRQEAKLDDLVQVASLALGHRVEQDTLQKVTNHLAALTARPDGTASPVSAMRQSFPHVSVGGAAVEEEPERNLANPVAPVPAKPPSVRPTPPPPAENGWLSRTLGGLKRNLGLGEGTKGAVRKQVTTEQRAGRTESLGVVPAAPPNPARPLRSLDPVDFVRTEEELNRL